MDKTVELFLKKNAEIITPNNSPPARFGHTVNLVSKTTVIVFGGAISSPGNYTMTADLYLYNMSTNIWKKLEPGSNSMLPHARAAHASATVRENQLLVYGGSIGNGKYASEDLWFLDVKNNEEASWMKVPIEGATPGLRYGHTMVYIMPILILFAGSGESEILNDIWIMSTDKTPFKWEKVSPNGVLPTARVYHTANLYKVAGNSEMMIIFGGRDKANNSLFDVSGIKKDTNNNWEWTDFSKAALLSDPNSGSGVNPIGRHQQCAAFFGPFLFVVGGRAGGKESATFDVFSMNKYKWYRFGNINLFRHSIWVYNNIISQDKYEVYLYIYGGFDGDNNSQINPNLYRVNIVDLFNRDETLKNELNDHISMILLIQTQKKNRLNQANNKNAGENKNVFTLNHRAVITNIDNKNDFANNVRTLSIAKLPEEGKKILENRPAKKNYVYDEQLVKEFLELMPLPEQFVPLAKGDRPIILSKDYILNLISQAKSLLEKTPCLINLQYPIKIFGSLNGQYNDLIRFFNVFGRPHEHRGDIDSFEYLFLGNFVNRGGFSVEVLCLLLALKLKHPLSVHILRGSTEELEISKFYGLGDECKDKFNEDIDDPNSVFRAICDLFNYLPLAALIENKIFCVHSGIGENVKTLEDIMSIKKPYSVYDNPVVLDLLWSTPEELKYEYTANNLTTNLRKRYYNENLVGEFMKNNKIDYIIRSHEVLEHGFEKLYDGKVVSIYSALNYCGMYNNSAGIISINKTSKIQPKILTSEENFSVWNYSENYIKDYPPSPKVSLKK